ncbi:MAG: preprotein translocase subunit SecG [Pseudomonadota bacterium]
MYTILIVVQVLVAVALVGLILLQHGKGADAGAAFGSGASGTVFGSRGSANFLSRATGGLATVFFAVSLALAYLVHGEREPESVVDRVQPQGAPVTAVPDAPTPAPAGEEQPAADRTPVVPE